MIISIILLVVLLAMIFGLLYLVLRSKPETRKPKKRKAYTRVGKGNMDSKK